MAINKGKVYLKYSISHPMENVADEQLHQQNYSGYVLPVCGKNRVEYTDAPCNVCRTSGRYEIF
jgi:hypothetical protein